MNTKGATNPLKFCAHVYSYGGVVGQSVDFFIHSSNKYSLNAYCVPGAATLISEVSVGGEGPTQGAYHLARETNVN